MRQSSSCGIPAIRTQYITCLILWKRLLIKALATIRISKGDVPENLCSGTSFHTACTHQALQVLMNDVLVNTEKVISGYHRKSYVVNREKIIRNEAMVKDQYEWGMA
jgi:hypothetical protein